MDSAEYAAAAADVESIIGNEGNCCTLSEEEEEEDEEEDDGDCAAFHLLHYCGCAQISQPQNDEVIASIVEQLFANGPRIVSHVSVPKSDDESVRLFDEQSCLIGTFPISKILYCKKSLDEGRRYLAFTFLASSDRDGSPCYQCHVFRSDHPSTINAVMAEFGYAFSIARDERSTVASVEQVQFELDAHLDIKEKDEKGNMCISPQEKCCFKLRRNRERLIRLVISQRSGPEKLTVTKCFGVLLAAGKNVKNADMQLLDMPLTETNNAGEFVITAFWDARLPSFEVLNTETPRETRVFMTASTDLLFADIPEPLRFTVCCRVRVFDEHERFWYIRSKPVGETYRLCIERRVRSLAESKGEVRVVHFDTVEQTSVCRQNCKQALVNLVAPPEENESDSDEPLLSGSGEVNSECSEAVLADWKRCLDRWKENLDERPKELNGLIRGGVPDQLRREVWQLLAGCHLIPEVAASYRSLLEQDCPNEQIILRDIHRTFPAHEYFKHSGGFGQDALYKISKAYAVYDTEVGYCQGLSFLAASLLLHMPEENAFSVLIRIMYHYGLRDLFKHGFETLHLRFYQLDQLMREFLPALSEHFDRLSIETHMFASQWFLTLFTAKFPLSMVFRIIDLFLIEGMNTIFHIALALLKASQADLLMQDFEGALKYFRVALPRKYRTEYTAKELISSALNLSVSSKKIVEFEQRFFEMKREEALNQNPIERLERENLKLREEIIRLQRENDDLACELVSSKVHLRNDLDMAEENIESLQDQLERTTRMCVDLQEENRNLRSEAEHVKETCRREFLKLEHENKRGQIMIDDYKQHCGKLSAQVESLEKKLENERKMYRDITDHCESCSPRMEESQQNFKDELESCQNGGSVLSADAEQIAKINRLELELAEVKLELVEYQCRNQELTHRLSQCSACHEQKSTWISKTFNSIKEAARNPHAVVNSKKDKEVLQSSEKQC